MSNFYVIWLLAGLCAFIHCHHTSTHLEDHSQDSPDEGHHNLPLQAITAANADFAFKFYHEVAREAAGKNILFSPLSISTALAMLFLGAKSDTHRQLLSGLGFNETEITDQEIHEGFRKLRDFLNQSSEETELNLRNALFIDEERKPSQKFLHDAKHFYMADICQSNFSNSEEAEEQINNYIEKKTNGKLVAVIKAFDPNALMVLVNYMSMKAYWENPFNPNNTQEDSFFVDEHITVTVPMMFRNGLYKIYRDTDLSCQVVELPYKGTTSALFILPDSGKMKQVEDALGKDLLSKWLNSLREERIDLYLPKLSIDGKYVLQGILRRLGITDILTDKADRSGIIGNPELKVSKVIHQAYTNVCENGTEAAATTVTEIVPKSIPPKIIFNRPFLMIMIDTITGSVTLIGRTMSPNENLTYN